jgi:hypothetical protein
MNSSSNSEFFVVSCAAGSNCAHDDVMILINNEEIE